MIRHTALAVLLAAAPVLAQTKPAPAGQTKPPAAAKPPASAAVPAALKPMQGTWVLTTQDGQPLSPNGLTITITGDKYAQAEGGTVNERGTMKLDATKKPMWLDLTITEGNDAGKHQVGLIEVTGGTMKGVFAPAGSTTRPTSLTPAQGVISFAGKKKV